MKFKVGDFVKIKKQYIFVNSIGKILDIDKHNSLYCVHIKGFDKVDWLKEEYLEPIEVYKEKFNALAKEIKNKEK